MCLMCNPNDDTCHIFCIWWLLGSQCCGSQSEGVCVVTRVFTSQSTGGGLLTSAHLGRLIVAAGAGLGTYR